MYLLLLLKFVIQVVPKPGGDFKDSDNKSLLCCRKENDSGPYIEGVSKILGRVVLGLMIPNKSERHIIIVGKIKEVINILLSFRNLFNLLDISALKALILLLSLWSFKRYSSSRSVSSSLTVGRDVPSSLT